MKRFGRGRLTVFVDGARPGSLTLSESTHFVEPRQALVLARAREVLARIVACRAQ